MGFTKWCDRIWQKTVLFITTKNEDYIRNNQEIKSIEKNAKSIIKIYSDKGNYLFRIFDIYVQIIKLNIKNIDEIFIGFAPQLILPFMNHKFRKKYITIDFFISVYDTFVDDRKRVRSNSIIAKIMHYIDQKTLFLADSIIADTNAHADYFSKEFGVGRDKIETYYLEADKSIYHPQIVKRPTSLNDKCIVLYFGSILPVQGVDIVLKTFDELKNDDRFYFYLIGKIGNQYEKPISKNIEYIDWLTQEDLAKKIAIADLCLAGHFSAEIGKANRTVPGKAYIYQSMGKRMVLGDSLANREVFRDDNMHYFVNLGDSEQLTKIIIKEGELCINLHN